MPMPKNAIDKDSLFSQAHVDAVMRRLEEMGLTPEELNDIQNIFVEDAQHLESVASCRAMDARGASSAVMAMDRQLHRRNPRLSGDARRQAAEAIVQGEESARAGFESRWGATAGRIGGA